MCPSEEIQLLLAEEGEGLVDKNSAYLLRTVIAGQKLERKSKWADLMILNFQVICVHRYIR